MRWQALVAALSLMCLVGCGSGVGATFEQGVEAIPGPGHLVIRIDPPEMIDERSIRLSGYGDRIVLFRASRGEDRFLVGLDLPSTVRAYVDGRECAGEIQMLSGIEYDGTLTIEHDACELRSDLAHPEGAIDHHFVDDSPVAS